MTLIYTIMIFSDNNLAILYDIDLSWILRVTRPFQVSLLLVLEFKTSQNFCYDCPSHLDYPPDDPNEKPFPESDFLA